MEENRNPEGLVSMERSKSFVNALQDLKNLRPQLYSAAEYCEKSYLHSEQKQMVLDNLKEYVVRALVNVVDHLGTVAYIFNDLLDQHTVDVNTMDLKLISLNQRVLTCQTYMDKEGLRQQKLLAVVPRHHKRYKLPDSVNKKVRFGPTDHARQRNTPSGSPSAKTLSWHLASVVSKPFTKLSQTPSASFEVHKSSPKPNTVFHLLDNEDDSQTISSAPPQSLPSSRNSVASTPVQSFGDTYKDSSLAAKHVAFKSFNNHTKEQQQQQKIISAPPRSRSMLSSLFVKQRTLKPKAETVS